ncbi:MULTISPECIES: alpha/beta hydrolase fold domain-containing protein [unclassified Afipia]|uniref:alpha/beta hydrolase fold domain-containing protein n=1 Tax=unclassified Afipia TaxID=2642050 RepID=UPI0004656F8C|nr:MULTISPECIES: alpha/beta hydrolase fold domain-containing protein [unclassified Afipia]
MHVIIVGAGIAGMAAAIALHQKGVGVTVLEQASALKEIGAGIQLAANGSLVLRELGLEDAVAQKGVIPQSYEMRDIATGKLIYGSPLGAAGTKHWGAPLYNIHRADLIDILARAMPKGMLRLGVQCTGFEQDDEGVTVSLASGEKLRGDALIGADGIHSAIRKQMRGEEPTHFSNILMWRALIPADKLGSINLEEKGNYWFGPGRTLITYWVRPNNLYSILASVPATEVQRESWTESGDIDELHRSFSDIEPRARKMMEQIDASFITGMYYRDPIDRWTYGRVTLMGDAAHPMVPFLAQGACQGIEDAWTLATVLSQRADGNVPAALLEYEQRRRPRTTRVQSGARAMVKLTHESEADRIRARDGRWKGMQHIDPMTETTWGFVWGYDVLKAVKQSPGEVLGLSATREGKSLKRPESQRAFTMWKNTFSPENVARGHDGLREGYDRFLATNFPLPKQVQVETLELRGVPALQVRSSKAGSSSGPTVLHFHGGGYVLGSASGSLEYAGRLAETVGGSCVTVDYRLAPEHPYPAAVDDAVDAYRGLLDNGVPASSIILSGESSGGGLALALALVLKTAGDPLPAGIIGVCPFVDLTLRGPTVAKFSGDDPAANRDVLAYLGASYFQGHEPTDPLVSPLYGHLSGLPPMFLTASEGEVLLSDTTRFAERAKQAGVDVTTRIVEDSVHVYTIFPFLPETVSTLQAIGAWVGDRVKR